MNISRRAFLAAAGAIASLPRAARSSPWASGVTSVGTAEPLRFDPWIEVDAGALRHNAAEAQRLSGRPVLAVIKNNAYGLGLTRVGAVLDGVSGVRGCAVVKTDAAIALRDAGFRKPILLMGAFDEAAADELIRRDVRLALYRPDDGVRCERLAARYGRAVRAHYYIDTGMGRMGMPYRDALPWIEDIASRRSVIVEGTFTALTEDALFDPIQLERFQDLALRAATAGAALGPLHAASSHALFLNNDAHLDMVRPGLALYGAYPTGARALEAADLRLAFALKVRVERLEKGDGVSYGRNYVAKRPTWIATLPVGHADGYPRAAVKGCQVAIRKRIFPVIGAVSASHTIVELGDQQLAEVGDVATLVGAEHEAIHPNAVAERAGVSVYDVLMHLNPELPRGPANRHSE